MVVEGANDERLAIECDGDRYHGPDKWADDMQRQRVLERAGWVFWRCFASGLRSPSVLRFSTRPLEHLAGAALSHQTGENSRKAFIASSVAFEPVSWVYWTWTTH